MARLILLNKPYGVLSQFTDRGTGEARATLSDHVAVPGVYPAGRLDRDSEGLLLLTDDGGLQARIADPRFKLAKTYLVQVEGARDDAALDRLRRGHVGGQFWSVWIPADVTGPRAVELTLEQIDVVRFGLQHVPPATAGQSQRCTL